MIFVIIELQETIVLIIILKDMATRVSMKNGISVKLEVNVSTGSNKPKKKYLYLPS